MTGSDRGVKRGKITWRCRARGAMAKGNLFPGTRLDAHAARLCGIHERPSPTWYGHVSAHTRRRRHPNSQKADKTPRAQKQHTHTRARAYTHTHYPLALALSRERESPFPSIPPPVCNIERYSEGSRRHRPPPSCPPKAHPRYTHALTFLLTSNMQKARARGPVTRFGVNKAAPQIS